MEESKMGELAKQLLNSAKARKLNWEEGTRSNSYMVDFPDVTLSISAGHEDFFTLELINQDGTVVETLSLSVSFHLGGHILEEIYDIARHHVLDVDGTIDKALEYLKAK